MAAIHELLSRVEDEELRAKLEEEFNKLSKQKKFGLVFEEHLPECTPLFDMPIKRGSVVAKKAGAVSEMYDILAIKDGIAACVHQVSKEREEIPVEDLVCVAQFGDPIYPYLKPIDSVCNAPDSDLWHTLIEADNYHALQLLEYLYPGKVDCIYIDPPYNTGARDWKYNNDYVDSLDAYRHSKWLSFMERRLRLAKRLLNPQESVLIVTIDDKEYLHLGCLLEELFPDASIQMISDVINPKGTMQRKKYPRTDEYIFLVMVGDAEPQEMELSPDWLIGDTDNTNRNRYRWVTFVRTASNVSRAKTPSMFYPIYVSEDGTKVTRVGDSLPLDVDYKSIKPNDGERVIFPINSQGREVIWHLSQESFLRCYEKGYIHLGQFTKYGMSIGYLSSGMQDKIEDGSIPVVGYNPDGSVIFDASGYATKFIPGSQWRIKTHDATEHGTKLLQKIIGNRFSYPKSLYSVHDVLSFFVNNKKNALVLDFFAGSGTTLNAINLLNAEDGGHRRCIMVTNNEVSDAEAKNLAKSGYKPGDPEWESLGIARYVTWPRTVCSIEGHDVNGNPLKGNYLGSDIPMADGFKANAAYFKLGFLDKTSVSLGRQLIELLPVLWMKAGAHGACPNLTDTDLCDYWISGDNKMAILINTARYSEFESIVKKERAIETVYIITDYEAEYRTMRNNLNVANTYQLYRDYLDNFRINKGR